MNKKTKKELIIGGAVLVAAGIAYYLYSQAQTAAASSAATVPATNPPASTPLASVPAQTPVTTDVTAPVVNDDPTQANAMVFAIEWVVADNQAGKYNVQFYLSITNNTGIAQTLQNVSGSARFNSIASAYNGDSKPSPYTGNLGNVSDGTTITIPAGQTVGKLYSVAVPIQSDTNFYVAQLAYINADPSTPRNAPFVFNGIAMVSGDSIPLSLTYLL